MALDNKSLVSSANYLTDLNSTYSKAIVLAKNNVLIPNGINHTIEATISYFDKVELIDKELLLKAPVVIDSNASMLAELANIVSEISAQIDDAIILNSSAINGTDLLIDISVSTDLTILRTLNIKVKYGSVLKYDLDSTSNEYIQILTNAGLFDLDMINSISNIGTQILPNIDEILLVDNKAAQVASDTLLVTEMKNDVTEMRDTVVEKESLVSPHYDNIDTVADSIDNVNLTGYSIVNVNNVGDNITNVNIVGADILNVNKVANIDDEVELVGINIDNVNIVADNIASVNTDANNISDINTVASDLNLAGWSNIIDAGSITDPVELIPSGVSYIKTVALEIDNVTAIGENIDDVITVANNLAVIESVSENIVDIQNAEENASIAIQKAQEALQSASISSTQASIATIKASEALASASNADDSETNALASKNLAEKWASEAEDVVVASGKYSSYHYMLKAEEFASLSLSVIDDTVVGTDRTYSSNKIETDLNVIGFDLAANVTAGPGQIAWNATEGTYDMGLENGSVLQAGQENIRKVTNNSGALISDGRLVMYNGTNGASGRINVKPFTAGFDEAIKLYGVATQSIANGSDGIITIEGKVRGLDTTGASVGEVWADNDILYAKPNDNGMMTKIEPADNELKIVVASVIKAHHTNGTLEIRFMPFNENAYYTKVQNDILLNSKVPLSGDFTLDLGGL